MISTGNTRVSAFAMADSSSVPVTHFNDLLEEDFEDSIHQGDGLDITLRYVVDFSKIFYDNQIF